MFENTALTLDILLEAAYQTFFMVGWSMLFGTILGFLIAILLFLTHAKGLHPSRMVYGILNPIVNMLRSIPFIILTFLMIPISYQLVGTSIGMKAAIIPLTVYVAPYLGRLIESALLEVDQGIIEAAQSMGANTKQIIFSFVIPEAKKSIILNLTTGFITLIGATAMVGAIGAGGIGTLAEMYGYQRYDTVVMIATVVILIMIIQGVQSLGQYLAHRR